MIERAVGSGYGYSGRLGHSSLEPLISCKNLAKMLDCSERTVRSWVLERRIPYHKIGKLVRFRGPEVRALIESGRVDPMVVGVLPSERIDADVKKGESGAVMGDGEE